MIRNNAANSLGEFGAAARAAIPKLVSLTSDPDSRVREVATNALKRIYASHEDPR
jgi:HEAT repeat protein